MKKIGDFFLYVNRFIDREERTRLRLYPQTQIGKSNMKRNVVSALAVLTSTDGLVTSLPRVGSEINPRGGATRGTAATADRSPGCARNPSSGGACRQAALRGSRERPRRSAPRGGKAAISASLTTRQEPIGTTMTFTDAGISYIDHPKG
jgi:hypothetical protein